MKKILLFLTRFTGVSYWTLINKIKLRLMGRVGRRFKSEGVLYLPAIQGNIEIGDQCHLGPCVRIGVTQGAKMIIGNRVSINQGTFIISRQSVLIGSGTRIGEYVSIRDNDHKWDDPDIPIVSQGFVTSPIVIEEDVWIGRGVVIQKGVKIGKGAVVGANSVVTKDVEPYSVVVGVPAKKIKMRLVSI